MALLRLHITAMLSSQLPAILPFSLSRRASHLFEEAPSTTNFCSDYLQVTLKLDVLNASMRSTARYDLSLVNASPCAHARETVFVLGQDARRTLP